METTATSQSRRKCISEYMSIIKKHEDQEALALTHEEEHRRNTKKELEENSQNNIYDICKKVHDSYTEMVNAGKDMRQIQDELKEKEKEEELFHKTADEIYSLMDINEDDMPKMKLCRIAYYILPILDCVFCWLALSSIITAKVASMGSFPAVIVEAIGVFSSLFMGYGLSFLSRMAVASLDGDYSAKRWVKRVAIGACMLILPSLYLVSEAFFNGGNSYIYSCCFAAISFVIQLLIVTGYKSHIDAINYFRYKKKNDKAEASREADEKAIREEVKALRGKIQDIITSFDAEYAKFTDSFRDLASARDKHIIEFGKDARYYLNQLVIYIGDLVCFRREVIPLYYESNGTVSTIPFVDFPNVYGRRRIFANSDFIYLDYMLQRGHTGISLTETIRALSTQPYFGLNSNGSDEGDSPSLSQQSKANDVYTTGMHDTPLENESPDSIEDDSENGGIW